MKLGEWTVIIIVMIMVLQLLGITTGLGVLTKFGVSISNGTFTGFAFEGSTFWVAVLAILAVVSVGGAVVIGLFAKSYDTSLIIVPLVSSVLLMFGSTFISVITIPAIWSEVWIRNIVSIIFVGMGVAFLWSAVDYFAGR